MGIAEGLKRSGFEGEIDLTLPRRIAYATDASVYREVPVAVVYPRKESDIIKLVNYCRENRIPITVRAAGTSLAGQVVTAGIVADVSRYMTAIIEINSEERWVRVEPGVILDELNLKLRPLNLFFGPETSTSNRCTLGGMAGNNACGLHSLVYGSTRDHVLESRTVLSDGSSAIFGEMGLEDIKGIGRQDSLVSSIYKGISEIISNTENASTIRAGYPNRKIKRRNTGYALDILLEKWPLDSEPEKRVNLSSLLCGSEGTLAIITELKLALVPLPPPFRTLVCVHLAERNDAFKANLVALKHHPTAVEMMDQKILDLTKDNIDQRRNRFFIDGEPAAILIVELADESDELLLGRIGELISDMKSSGFGYSFPVVKGSEISRVWNVRKAGLGLLANMYGDAKSVSLIEDTAIGVEELPDYMKELEGILKKYDKEAVYHAHIGTGELHIRPILDLKNESDVIIFRALGEESARLVKKYRGSLSGEHGDGRLRGEFIPIVLGEENYKLLKYIKELWDPESILNPGIITNTPPMDSSLRYEPGIKTPELSTWFDFSGDGGIIRTIEKCNGSGDCRKGVISGGTMCPSYMASGDEMLSTRARSNILREYLSREVVEPWDSREIFDILDLCLACKGCKSECPSNMDIAKIKSEFLYHWHKKHGMSVRTRLIANIGKINRVASLLPGVYNWLISTKLFRYSADRILRVSMHRQFPKVGKLTVRKWAMRHLDGVNPENPVSEVCLFVDEFTNYNDCETGINTIKLLTGLGYKVAIGPETESGRAYISKGVLRRARSLAIRNLLLYSPIAARMPVLGIEPSAILTFRDEYPDLVGAGMKERAINLGRSCLLLEEFISEEYRSGRIKSDQFSSSKQSILVHGHCQQKALVTTSPMMAMLAIPSGFNVREINSGCCGMAGSFGYEKEHFDLSMKVGELVLFPAVRESDPVSIIAAPGTSCRQHIAEGTGREATHPVNILLSALRV